MRTVSISKTLATASVNGICQSQSLASAGTLAINGTLATGGVANLVTQRRVAVISGGNDSARKVTITGTGDAANVPIADTFAMANTGTAFSDMDFLNINTISVDGSIASTVTIGTDGTGSTPWIMPNFHLTPFDVTINTELSGSVTYNIETTQDNYWSVPQPTGTTPAVTNVYAVVSGSTAAAQTVLDTAVRGYRYTITSGTGTLTAQGTQAGISNY